LKARREGVHVRTIFRAEADRLTISEAKRLLRDALPREPALDVYVALDEHGQVEPEGEIQARQVPAANVYEPHLDADFPDACEQLGITPRWKYRPTQTGYTGEKAQDDLYTITHEEFVAYAHLFDIQVGVRDRKEFRRGPIVAPLLEELRELPPEEEILISERVSACRRSDSMATAAKHIKLLEGIAAQQSKGILTVRDAAWLLAESYHGLDLEDLIARMMAAKLAGQRLIRQPSGFPAADGEKERDWHLVVKAAEVDAWLQELGVEYRVVPLLERYGADHKVNVPDVPALAPADPNAPAPMVKGDVALLFDGVKWPTQTWERELAAPPAWLRPARIALGERGRRKAPSTWNPIEIASILMQRGETTEQQITDAFVRAKQFLSAAEAWLPKWKAHLQLRAWGK
jgi:hypothetical protein